MTDEPPRYTSLRDYARLLRRQWLIIVVPVIVAAAAALVYSLHERDTYDARAQVLIQDESQALTLLGTPVVGSTTNSSAGIIAETASTPALAAQVRRHLRARVPAATLMGDVSLSIDTSTGLLDVNATGPSAKFAAALANAYARRIAATTTASTTRQLAAAARVLQRRLSHLSPAAPGDAGEQATLQDEISRLDFVQATATPGQVVRTAFPASEPASPKPVRNVALGLLAGLLIGLVAAFLRESFDRRMRGSDEIAGKLGFPLLGHVRRRTLGKAVQPRLAGDRDGAGDVETFRILRNNVELQLAEQTRRAVIVTSALPEEGKSTVAASLAFASAAAGRRTLLVEADLRRPSLARRLGIAPTPGLADYLSGGAESAVGRAIPVFPGAGGNGDGNGNGNGKSAAPAGPLPANLICIPAGSVGDGAAELLASGRMREFLADVASEYQFVILDTAPLLPVADTLGLLAEASAVILCVRSGQTTHEQMQAARAALAPVKPQAVGIVVTDVHGRDQAAGQGLYPYRYSYAGRPD
jgi:Mrp family chromosome partitioning ATPase